MEKELMEKAEKLAESFDGGWWNYRIIEIEESWTDKEGKVYTEKVYEIHEVYYNGNGDVIAWTKNSIGLFFDDYDDLRDVLKHIKKASKKTVLKLIKENDNEKLIDTNKKIKKMRWNK